MDKNVRTAILKTIKTMADCGVKIGVSNFRENDIIAIGTEGWKRTTIITTMSGTINLYIYFDEVPRAKAQSVKDKILNYYNATLHKDYIVFKYSTKELEIVSADADAEKTETVIRKVEKLLRMSQDKCNEHEAISASLMAQKLLAKYGLTLDDVDGGIKKDIPIENVRVDVGNGNNWKYRLSLVVANNYRCKVYTENNSTFVFMGYRDDIMVARQVFAYLFNTANRLGKEYKKQTKKNGDYVDVGTFNSYCLGFVNAVSKELSKQSTELMIITPQSVEDKFNEMAKDWKTQKKKLNMGGGLDEDAYVQGEHDGKNAVNAQYIDDNSKYLT